MSEITQHRSPGKTLAGVLFLIVGLICATFVVVYLARDLSLWIFGRNVTGEVVELWAEQTSEQGAQEVTFDFFVRYQFTASDGRVIVGTSRVAPEEWAGLGKAGRSHAAEDPLGGEESASAPVYHEQKHVPQFPIGGLQKGSPIDVIYFSLDPEHNRLKDTRFVSLFACAYVPLVLLSLVGLVGGWRLVRQPSEGISVHSLRELLRQDRSDSAQI